MSKENYELSGALSDKSSAKFKGIPLPFKGLPRNNISSKENPLSLS